METQVLHFAELKLAISPNVGDSGAQFLVGGVDCVRASPVHYIQTELVLYHVRLTLPNRHFIKTHWNGLHLDSLVPRHGGGGERAMYFITTEYSVATVYICTLVMSNLLH